MSHLFLRSSESEFICEPSSMKLIDTDFIMIRLVGGGHIKLMLQPGESFSPFLASLCDEMGRIDADKKEEELATAAEEEAPTDKDDHEPSFATTDSSFCELVHQVGGLSLVGDDTDVNRVGSSVVAEARSDDHSDNVAPAPVAAPRRSNRRRN